MTGMASRDWDKLGVVKPQDGTDLVEWKNEHNR